MPAIDHNLLRRLRDERDLSNGDLADKAGVDPKYLSNIICGYNAPSMRIVHRLARALGLPVDAVLAKPTGDPSDPPKQPAREPKGPPRRQDRETTRGPRRAKGAAA